MSKVIDLDFYRKFRIVLPLQKNAQEPKAAGETTPSVYNRRRKMSSKNLEKTTKRPSKKI